MGGLAVCEPAATTPKHPTQPALQLVQIFQSGGAWTDTLCLFYVAERSLAPAVLRTESRGAVGKKTICARLELFCLASKYIQLSISVVRTKGYHTSFTLVLARAVGRRVMPEAMREKWRVSAPANPSARCGVVESLPLLHVPRKVCC